MVSTNSFCFEGKTAGGLSGSLIAILAPGAKLETFILFACLCVAQLDGSNKNRLKAERQETSFSNCWCVLGVLTPCGN